MDASEPLNNPSFSLPIPEALDYDRFARAPAMADCVALDDVIAKDACCLLPELGATLRLHAIPDGYDDIQAVEANDAQHVP